MKNCAQGYGSSPPPGSLNLGMSRGVGGGLGGVDSRRRATDRGAGGCVTCPAQKRRPRQAVSSGALPSRCCWSGRFEPRPVARRGPGPCAAGGWRSVDDKGQTPLNVVVRQSPIACQQSWSSKRKCQHSFCRRRRGVHGPSWRAQRRGSTALCVRSSRARCVQGLPPIACSVFCRWLHFPLVPCGDRC